MRDPRRLNIRSLAGRATRRIPHQPRDNFETLTNPEDEPVPERQGQSLIDSAVYIDGERVASPTSLAETFESLRLHDGATAWIGLYRPGEDEVASLASEFGLHELGGRGCDRRPPAAQARTLRRHAVRRPPRGVVRRRDRGGRVRRDPRVRRSRLRDHRPPRRVTGAGERAAAAGEQPRAAPART